MKLIESVMNCNCNGNGNANWLFWKELVIVLLAKAVIATTLHESYAKKRPLQSTEPVFNPTAACIALQAKRMSLMVPFCYSVPRGEKRKALQEKTISK